MKKVSIYIQSFGRDEDGFNDDEEDFEAELNPKNFSQVISEAELWMKEREFRDGDLSGFVGISHKGVLDTNNTHGFNSIEEFQSIKMKIPEIFTI